MRKQYGLKFEDEFIKQVDDAAEELGLTRTGLLEAAAERFMADPVPVTPRATSSGHTARGGERIAWICMKCAPPRPRTFSHNDQARPRCDIHGSMERQENRPYFGQPT